MSRNDILRALGRSVAPPVRAPPGAGPWTTYADRPAQFANALTTAGGCCVDVHPEGSIEKAIEELSAHTDASRILCRLSGFDRTTIDLPSEPCPQDYQDVDLAALSGVFGVAENGAVWVTDEQASEPSLLFLATHLALVIDRREIVDNMHQAYRRISFTRRGFGTFIAGPSKTADIERALVIGAHGPRSLTVLLRS